MNILRMRLDSAGFVFRAQWLALLLPAGLFWIGCNELILQLRNPSPSEFRCREYIDSRPSARWVKLTDGTLQVAEGVADWGNHGHPSEVFIPLLPVGEATGAAVHIFVATKDEEVLDLLDHEEIRAGNHREAFLDLAGRMEALLHRSVYAGVVRDGDWALPNLEYEEEEQFLKPLLAPDFVVLELDEQPGGGVGFLVFAVIVGGIQSWVLIAQHRRRRTPPPLPRGANR